MATDGAPPEPVSKLVRQKCNSYGPDTFKAIRASVITLVLVAAFSIFAAAYPCKLAAALLGCAIVRAFVLFHDAAHGALMGSRRANQVIAAMVSPWIARTAAGWSASHNHHHKVLGSDPPPFSLPTLRAAGLAVGHDDSRTVLFSRQEFESWSPLKQAFARLVRDPFFFFGVVVPLQWPMRAGELTAQVSWLVLQGVFYRFGGLPAWVCFLEACWFALFLAGILFHLQHQVNPGYWKDEDDGYNRDDACLNGCSYLLVPWCLKWVTLGIEYHHIHHLSIRVPCYELQNCHESCDPQWLTGVVEVSMYKAIRSCFHTMWDEKAEKFVSFDSHRALGLED